MLSTPLVHEKNAKRCYQYILLMSTHNNDTNAKAVYDIKSREKIMTSLRKKILLKAYSKGTNYLCQVRDCTYVRVHIVQYIGTIYFYLGISNICFLKQRQSNFLGSVVALKNIAKYKIFINVQCRQFHKVLHDSKILQQTFAFRLAETLARVVILLRSDTITTKNLSI